MGARKLAITNTLTMAANGLITNENSDYAIDAGGYKLQAGQAGVNSIEWYNGNFNDAADVIGNIFSYYNSGLDENITVLGATAQGASAGRIVLSAGKIRLFGNDIGGMGGIPTSEPSEAGKLYTQTATQLGGSGSERVVCLSTGTAPSAPSQPSVCKQSNALIVSWDAVAQAETYDVQRRTGGSGTWTNWITDTTSTSEADTAPSGNPDTIYEYRVRACNGNGCSAYSTESADTTYNTASSC